MMSAVLLLEPVLLPPPRQCRYQRLGERATVSVDSPSSVPQGVAHSWYSPTQEVGPVVPYARVTCEDVAFENVDCASKRLTRNQLQPTGMLFRSDIHSTHYSAQCCIDVRIGALAQGQLSASNAPVGSLAVVRLARFRGGTGLGPAGGGGGGGGGGCRRDKMPAMWCRD